MKKYLILLALLVPTLAFVACSDDDDLPMVAINFEIDGASKVDGVYYVVQGETMTIESITVVNQESDKNAAITQADYYWDYHYIGTSIQPPYGFELKTDENTPVGKHLLEVEMPVIAVNKTPGIALTAFKIMVVANEDEVPEPEVPSVTKVYPKVSSTSDKTK